jgi:hypothetical protein
VTKAEKFTDGSRFGKADTGFQGEAKEKAEL